VQDAPKRTAAEIIKAKPARQNFADAAIASRTGDAVQMGV
jgi:hypothetical protein